MMAPIPDITALLNGSRSAGAYPLIFIETWHSYIFTPDLDKASSIAGSDTFRCGYLALRSYASSPSKNREPFALKTTAIS